jgi:hypothetical protein
MRILTIALMAAVALTSLQAASAQTRIQPQQAPQGVTLQKQIPKPDFVILHASAIGGNDDMSVRVDAKNAVAETNENNNFRLFNW